MTGCGWGSGIRLITGGEEGLSGDTALETRIDNFCLRVRRTIALCRRIFILDPTSSVTTIHKYNRKKIMKKISRNLFFLKRGESLLIEGG